MTGLFAMLARYNAWANQRLLAAAEALSDEDYRADCGAAFRSVHGTLNHLLVADRIWLSRFTGRAGDAAPVALDAIVADDRPALRREREKTDADLVSYTDRLSEEELAARFSYRRVSRPEPVTQPLAHALLHAFNHQTHHRGQVHAMLSRLAGEAPALDLVFYQRETGEGA
jgi:uncharacterized damage-inducible protein DinB